MGVAISEAMTAAMQVTVEDVSPVEKQVAVQIPWPDVKVKLDEAYKEITQHVTIKGFRKGHVPRHVLEKLFSQRLDKEMARQIAEETFPKALEEKGLHAVAEPVIEDDGIKQGAAFTYRARVEVAPEIVPKGYDAVSLKRRLPKITDEHVERAIEHRREQVAEFRPIEGRDKLQPGDVIVCDVIGKVGDKPFSAEGIQQEVGTGVREPLPGFGAVLAGRPLAEKEFEVSFTLPADAADEKLRSAKAKLLVTVKDAREKRLPALDDEFAKDTGEADTLADLRGIVRKKLGEAVRHAADRDVRQSLIKELLAKNPFEVSPALIERRLDQVIGRLQGELAAQGIDLRKAPVDHDRLREEARSGAADGVRSSLLLEAIARREGVEVQEADVDKRLAEIARSQGRGQNVTRMRADFEKEGRLVALRSALREEKTLDLLISKATITDEEVSVESLAEGGGDNP
jgi:trigger factor